MSYDIWETRDHAKTIGCQLRAGKERQHNPAPGSAHPVHGWRARISRALRQVCEFVQVWREYRPHHTFRNTWRIARDIAFRGCPF